VSAAPARDAGWLVDASVALKWFLPVEREADAALARSAIGEVAFRTTTLAFYEVGNILIRQSDWDAVRVAAALNLLADICGDPVDLLPEDRHATAHLAQLHKLTFYDASYAAVAQRLGRVLVSADADLLDAGLAQSLAAALD
jgi:predicted nucleic acid-binding protein